MEEGGTFILFLASGKESLGYYTSLLNDLEALSINTLNQKSHDYHICSRIYYDSLIQEF